MLKLSPFRRSTTSSTGLLGSALAIGVLLTGCETPPPVVPPQGIPPMIPGAPSPPPQEPFAPQQPGTEPLNPANPTGDASAPAVVEPPPPPAAEMSPQARAAYEQGQSAFRNDDLAGAQQAFAEAVRSDPRAHQAHFALGAVYERAGNASAAAAAYQQALAVKADFAPAIVAYAMLQVAADRLGDAEGFLNERLTGISDKPARARVLAGLAEVRSIGRDTAGAQQRAQEALKLDPSCAPAMVAIARDHYRARRIDLALYALRAILDGLNAGSPARDANNVDARLLRAQILFEEDRRVPAMEDYKRVMEQRPDLTIPRLRYASYLLESGGAAEAIPLLQRALRYDSNNMGVHLSLGDAYRLTGDFAKARTEFDWVKQQDPNLAPVYYNLGLLYLFAAKVEGLGPREQVGEAISSLNRFKELASKGEQADVEELLKKAKTKKDILDAEAAANAPQPETPPPAPPPTGETPPAAGESPPANPGGGNP